MKTLIWKDTCTLTFIAALFIRAKTGKVPNCPSTDEWIKKMWGTHPQIHVKGAQSCLTPCDPMDCSPPGSSVRGILKVRILKRVAILFSRASSWPRDWTPVSCITGRYFTIWDSREALLKDLPNHFSQWLQRYIPTAMHTGSNYFLSCQHFLHSNF